MNYICSVTNGKRDRWYAHLSQEDARKPNTVFSWFEFCSCPRPSHLFQNNEKLLTTHLTRRHKHANMPAFIVYSFSFALWFVWAANKITAITRGRFLTVRICGENSIVTHCSNQNAIITFFSIDFFSFVIFSLIQKVVKYEQIWLFLIFTK